MFRVTMVVSSLACWCVAGGAVPALASAQTVPRVVAFDSLTWRGGNGLEMATVSGDPAINGVPYSVMLRLAPGRWIAPHWHPGDTHLVVLSGTFRVGFGDAIDSVAAKRVDVGGAFDVPGTVHHYEGAVSASVVLLSGIGPLQTNPVAGAGDPHAMRPPPAAAPVLPPGGEATVDLLRAAYLRAYNAGDAGAMIPLYADSAVRMAYDARAQIGRDSIVAAYRTAFAARAWKPTLSFRVDAMENGMGSVVERGRYHEEMLLAAGGAPLIEEGKYVALMTRGADGRWRYTWSIFNRDGPAKRQ
jgi:ketosteroid isomerase-like protein/quercetin dioxygenase-like cupin family protein